MKLRLLKQTRLDWNVYISTERKLHNAYATDEHGTDLKDSIGINISRHDCILTIPENGQNGDRIIISNID